MQKNSNNIFLRFLLVTFLIVSQLFSIHLLYAQTTTWTGDGADNDWKNINNWDNGIPNSNTDDVVFPTGITPTLSYSATPPQSTTFRNITFEMEDPNETYVIENQNFDLQTYGNITFNGPSYLNWTAITNVTLNNAPDITLVQDGDDYTLFNIGFMEICKEPLPLMGQVK